MSSDAIVATRRSARNLRSPSCDRGRLGVAMALCASFALPRVAVSQSVPAPAHEPAEMREAREHFSRGIALFEHGDHNGALAEFLRAQTLSGRPGIWFNIGASYQALHRYPEALDALRRYLAEAPRSNPRQRADAERSLQEIEALIAHLRIAVEPAGATTLLDGVPVPNGADIAVGPGRHRIESTADGYQTAREEVIIASGETRVVTVALRQIQPLLPPAPPPGPVSEPTAVLEVMGTAPDASLEMNGVAYPVSAPVVVPPGRYSATIQQPRMRPWRGEITLAAGAPRTLRVSLVSEGPQTRPVYFWTAVASCAGLATSAAIFGIAALATHAEYLTLNANDPEADAVANRGRAFAAIADVSGLAAIFAGSVASYLLLRTEFVPRRSAAVLAVHPTSGGIGVTGRIAF